MLLSLSDEQGLAAKVPAGLPGRCIEPVTDPKDVVLDRFVETGTSIVDASASYIASAERKLAF